MTPSRILENLKDILGFDNAGLTDTELYRALTRAKEYLEMTTNITLRNDVAIITAVGGQTFDLTNSSVIELMEGSEVLEVQKVYYKNRIDVPLAKVSPSHLLMLRDFSPQTSIPTIFAINMAPSTCALDTFASKTYLEIYPAIDIAGSSFAGAYLYTNIKERTPSITASGTVVLPDYSMDALCYKAALNIFASLGDSRVGNIAKLFEQNLAMIASIANARSSGDEMVKAAQ